jgi:hypothetical protein
MIMMMMMMIIIIIILCRSCHVSPSADMTAVPLPHRGELPVSYPEVSIHCLFHCGMSA